MIRGGFRCDDIGAKKPEKSGLDDIPQRLILLASGLSAPVAELKTPAFQPVTYRPRIRVGGDPFPGRRLCLVMPKNSVIGAESSKELLWLS